VTRPAAPGHWPRALDAALVIAFLVAISLPGLSMIVRPPTAAGLSAIGEPQPALHDLLDQAESKLDAARVLVQWFRTRFGFRSMLVEANARLRVDGLGITTAGSVVVGSDGWLFYAGDHSIDSFRHAQPFSPAELASWRSLVDGWSKVCQGAGARLVVLVPPDKQTVYADAMPAWMTPLTPRSRLDELKAMFAGRSDLDFVDARGALADMRGTGLPLYYRTDTHWNELGAYVAAREVLRTLATRFPGLVVPPAITTAEVVRIPGGGDMARVLGLQDHATDEEIHFVSPLVSRATIQTPSGTRFTREMHVEMRVLSSRPDAPIPRLVVFRDSFGNALIPHLAEHFGSAVYLWTSHLDAELVQTTRPDVVIVELLERSLMKDPADIRDGR
jgi:hypothetical protein